MRLAIAQKRLFGYPSGYNGQTLHRRAPNDPGRADAQASRQKAGNGRPAGHLQALAGGYETRHVGLYKTAVAVRFGSADRLARRPRAFRLTFGFGACFLRLLEIIVVEPLATVETALEAGQRRPVAGSVPIRPPRPSARRSKRLLGPCARRERQRDRNRVVDRRARSPTGPRVKNPNRRVAA
jgi:hypothetical protein